MKNPTTKIAHLILFVGISLLAFTFISAYVFLINDPAITESSNIVDFFGIALAPLIGASIRVMYLGIMGWIGAGLTTRGIQLIIQLKRLVATQSQQHPIPNPTNNQTEPMAAKKGRKVLVQASQK